jgi:hypothetical protein
LIPDFLASWRLGGSIILLVFPLRSQRPLRLEVT